MMKWQYQIQRYKQKLFDNICKNFRDTEYHKIDEDFNTAVKLFDNLGMEANGLRRLLQSWNFIYIYSLFLWLIGMIGIKIHCNSVLMKSDKLFYIQRWILYLWTDSNIGIGTKSDQIMWKTAVLIGLRIVGFAQALFQWRIWAILIHTLTLNRRPSSTDSRPISEEQFWILNIQALIVTFIRSIKVQNWKWWRADRHCFSSVMRFESDAILVEMHLKFSLFFELLQNRPLLTIIDIEPMNWLEFFKHIRFYFYCRQDWFWNK